MKQLFLGSSLLICLAGLGAAHAQLQTTGYTFSRQQGISTSSSAQTTTLSVSRVLGQSCKNQVQDWYREQGIANWADQGCITEPENVIALPLVPGQLEQFQIIDKTRKFGVADQVVGSTSESATNQKAVTGFTGMGLSVFIQPQN